LYSEVTKDGGLTFNFPDLTPTQLRESCSLDLADQGSATIEETAAALNLSHEAVRLIEARALAKLSTLPDLPRLLTFAVGPSGKRRLPVLTGGN
jgi:hypothetical protein